LARLRDLFNDPLLTPSVTGKGMVPTVRGLAMKEPLRLALHMIQDVVGQSPIFDPLVSKRTFTVAANDNAGAMIGTKLIQALQPVYSGLRLALRSINATTLPDHLERGEIDLALVSENAIPKWFNSQALVQERFRLGQRKGHPRGTGPLSMEQYASLRHVMVSTSGGFHGFIDDVLHQRGAGREVIVSVQYYSLVPLILETTDIVCTLPARFLDRFSDRLDSFELPFATQEFTLFSTWHARFDNDPAHRWLRERIATCLSDDAGIVG
jgi:DNA-binding transcriptional LysR family regulator